LEIIDISDPDRPALISRYRSETRFRTALHVADGTAYLAGGQIEVVDVRDPARPTRIRAIQPQGADPRALAAAGDWLYLATRGGGLEVVSRQQRPAADPGLLFEGRGLEDVALRGDLALAIDAHQFYVLRLAPQEYQPAETLCFDPKTPCLSGPFLRFWRENGGLPVFGYPISPLAHEQNPDTGEVYPTQWFERNRFELHAVINTEPGNSSMIMLGRLGADRLRQDGLRWQEFPQPAAPGRDCLWFQETGHQICDQAPGAGFKTFWQTHGLAGGASYEEHYASSLALLGYPLSEPQIETNADGDRVLTQWFERARLEWHPGNPAAFRVLMGRLGAEVLSGGNR
jgi:hypothetical protein